MERAVGNADLSESDLPAPNADPWKAVCAFARTFHWPDHYDDHRAMLRDGAACVDAYRKGTLGTLPLHTLRAMLWFSCEALRWQVSGGPLPTADQLAFLRALVEAIREKLWAEWRD